MLEKRWAFLAPNLQHRMSASHSDLIKLLPKLTELRVYDNSEDADPSTGSLPEPRLILHMDGQTIAEVCDLGAAPAWTKAILVEAIRLHG